MIDSETTGLDPTKSEVIEICLLEVIDGLINRQFHSLVKPTRPISREVTRVTGIEACNLADAPTFIDIAAEIEAFVAGATMVCHYVRYERSAINSAMSAVGRQLRAVEWIDIIDLVPRDWPVEERSLAAISRRLDAGPVGTAPECALVVATAFQFLMGIER